MSNECRANVAKGEWWINKNPQRRATTNYNNSSSNNNNNNNDNNSNGDAASNNDDDNTSTNNEHRGGFFQQTQFMNIDHQVNDYECAFTFQQIRNTSTNIKQMQNKKHDMTTEDKINTELVFGNFNLEDLHHYILLDNQSICNIFCNNIIVHNL